MIENLSLICKKIFSYPLAIAIIIWENIFYKPVNALAQYLGRLEVFRILQLWISNLSPLLALVIFIIPIIAFIPFKLLGLSLMAHKHIIAGGITFIAAKILGAALFTRIFTLTESSIRKIEAINKSLNIFFDKKNKLLDFWRKSRLYVRIRELKLNIKTLIKKCKELAFKI